MRRSRTLTGALAALASASLTGAAAAAPVIPTTPPPALVTPGPPTASPSPQPAVPIPPAPARTPPPAAAAAWAVGPAGALAAQGLWSVTDPAALAAPATRRDAARLLTGLAGVRRPAGAPRGLADVPASDPGAAAIQAVVSRGWLSAPGGVFRPDDPVTSIDADRAFVRLLGLGSERRALAGLTTADGARLALPANFPSEVLVREAGLRHNYPSALDAYERSGADPLSRADLAGMGAGVLALRASPWRQRQLAAFARIALSAMTPVQRAEVERALSQVGQPYIWGGESPTTVTLFGAQAHGGFDCSGLAWWTERDPTLAEAGEDLPRLDTNGYAYRVRGGRVGVGAVAPGDLIFFGPAGRRSRYGSITHMAIALGDGWIVQSTGSRDGVSITRLATYWPAGVAFARRLAPATRAAPASPAPVASKPTAPAPAPVSAGLSAPPG